MSNDTAITHRPKKLLGTSKNAVQTAKILYISGLAAALSSINNLAASQACDTSN
jgi:hypothetical protein